MGPRKVRGSFSLIRMIAAPQLAKISGRGHCTGQLRLSHVARRSPLAPHCLFEVACNKNASTVCRTPSALAAASVVGRGGSLRSANTAVLGSSGYTLHQTSTRHSELIGSCFLSLISPLFFSFCGVETKRRCILLFLLYLFFFCTYAFTLIVRSKI